MTSTSKAIALPGIMPSDVYSMPLPDDVIEALGSADLVLTDDGAGQPVIGVVSDVRITSMWGVGRLVYVTRDAYLGIALDGERTVTGKARVDCYPAECVSIA